MFVYLLFARARKLTPGSFGFIAPEEITQDHLREVFNIIMEARGIDFGIEECAEIPRFAFLRAMVRDVELKDRESLYQTLQQVISKIRNSFYKTGIPDQCAITTRGLRGSLRYGLDLPPDRIIWS
ncbi:MAG: hypothetical protein KIT57_10385 [Blastocatellales bacterium]|nr:hypothetical protein [Blastocatellales bacterium]